MNERGYRGGDVMKTENKKIGGSLELPLWLLLTFCPTSLGGYCDRRMVLSYSMQV